MARPGLTGHRKFRRLARLLGSLIVARGALELLWDCCYEAGEDYVGTADDIEQAVGWTGERGVLARALVEAGAPEGHGFIEPVSDVVGEPIAYRVHDLWHHAPDYVAKRRQRELQRQSKADPGCVRRSAPNSAELGKSPSCQDETGRTPSPSPSPSPEKKDVSAETRSAFSATSAQEPVEVRGPSLQGSRQSRGSVFLVFPTVGVVKEWSLIDAKVSEWGDLFPGLDIRGEARKALAWVGADLGRRKTARGMERFLVGWLTRTVNRGGARSAMEKPPQSSRAEEGFYVPWECPHTPRCAHRAACAVVSARSG